MFFLILCLSIRFCSELILKTDISVSSVSLGTRGTWSQSPGIRTFPGISHNCTLPFELPPPQALSPESICQWRVQAGSHKARRTGLAPGPVQCSGPRRAVPSPGKPGCSRTHRKRSFAPEGAAVLLAACYCLGGHKHSSHHWVPCQTSLSPAGRKMLLTPMSKAKHLPCGRTSLHGSFPLWIWIQISRYRKNNREQTSINIPP